MWVPEFMLVTYLVRAASVAHQSQDPARRPKPPLTWDWGNVPLLFKENGLELLRLKTMLVETNGAALKRCSRHGDGQKDAGFHSHLD